MEEMKKYVHTRSCDIRSPSSGSHATCVQIGSLEPVEL